MTSSSSRELKDRVVLAHSERQPSRVVVTLRVPLCGRGNNLLVAARRFVGIGGGPVLQLTSRAGGLLLSIVTVMVVARHLGPAEYGVLALAMVVAQLLAALCDSGVYPVALAELSQLGGSTHQAWAIVRARLLLCAFALPITIAALTAFSLEGRWVVALGASSSVAYAFTAFRAVPEAHGRTGMVGLILLSQNIAWLLFVVALTVREAGVVWFVLAFNASVAVHAMFAFAAARNIDAAEPQTNLQALHLLRRALPMTISGLASTAYYRGHYLLLAGVLGASGMGNYAAAMRLMDSAQALPATFNSVYLPAASKRARDGLLGTPWVLRKCKPWAAMAGAFTAICIAIPDVIARVLWGPEFDGAAAVLPALGIAFLFICVGYGATATLVAAGASRYAAWVSGVGATLGIIAFATLGEHLALSTAPIVLLFVEAAISLGLLVMCARMIGRRAVV